MTKPIDLSAAAAALGRKGGQSTSERKAAASRANGKRGGRPRKDKVKMKSDNSKFKVGSGVYKCADCGKLTRDTGYGEGHTGLCRTCYIKAEQENYDSDCGEDEEETVTA